MNKDMRDALKHTLKELKASMRERRAKSYHDEEDDDEHSKVASGRAAGRDPGPSADAGRDRKKVAGKEGAEDTSELKEKSGWRDAQADFMKGRVKLKAVTSARFVDSVADKKKPAAVSKTPKAPQNNKKRETIT